MMIYYFRPSTLIRFWRTLMIRTVVFLSALIAALLTAPAPGQAETIYGYAAGAKEVFSFDSASPGMLSNVHPLTGVTNDPLEAIAVRPTNNQLYAVGANGIYTLNPLTGSVTRVSTSSIPYGLSELLGASFDPNTDQLRIVWENLALGAISYRNITVNVETGQATEYPSLTYAPGSGTGSPLYISNVAYGKGSAMAGNLLYGLDANPSAYTLDSIDPETGLVRRIGPIGNAPAYIGAELTISPSTGIAYAQLPIVTAGVISNDLYTVNLQTGRGTLVGQIGTNTFPGSDLVYLAAASTTAPVPEPNTVLLVSGSLAALVWVARRRAGERDRNGKI